MASKEVMLNFSSTPGCRERHLIRKNSNPLFSNSQLELTQEFVDEARQQDLEEYNQFLDDFNNLIQEVSQLEERIETEIILEFKERIDRMHDQCVGFGRDVSIYLQALSKLYETIMNTIRIGAANDTLAISELNKEQEARKLHLEIINYTLVSDLIRADSPIEENELVASLLSDSAESVQVVMSLFDSPQRELIKAEAARLVAALKSSDEFSTSIQQAYEAVSAFKL